VLREQHLVKDSWICIINLFLYNKMYFLEGWSSGGVEEGYRLPISPLPEDDPETVETCKAKPSLYRPVQALRATGC